MKYDINQYKNGETLPDGKICFVGPDGIARPVSSGLYETILEIQKRSHEYVDYVNETLKDDRWGSMHEVQEIAAVTKLLSQEVTMEEFYEMSGKTDEQRNATLKKAWSRVKKEYNA